MSSTLPTSLQADFLILRRAGGLALARALMAPAVLVAACVICACIGFYRRFGWCVPVSALLAVAGSYALVRSRLSNALLRSRQGWCGALPVRAHAMTRALLASAAVAIALAMVCASAFLLIAAWPAPHPATLGLALLAIDGGFVAGSLVAIVQVLRQGAAGGSRHAEGVREPLLALPWLNDRRIPHLLDWQRRAALVEWRRGGSFIIIGCVLAMAPTGAVMVVALVLLALSGVWLSVVMRACAATTVAAGGLLEATPVDLGDLRRAALRYPLIASVCAGVLAVIGAVLLHSFIPLGIWIACVIVAAARPVWSIVSATRTGIRS